MSFCVTLIIKRFLFVILPFYLFLDLFVLGFIGFTKINYYVKQKNDYICDLFVFITC